MEPGQERAEPVLTAAEAFDMLWGDLADVLGSAATAVLLRRALRDALAHGAPLDGLQIQRNGLDYAYQVPDAWRHDRGPAAVAPLRTLVGALGPLLVELTGPVVLRRLERLGTLRALGIESAEEVAAWPRSER